MNLICLPLNGKVIRKNLKKKTKVIKASRYSKISAAVYNLMRMIYHDAYGMGPNVNLFNRQYSVGIGDNYIRVVFNLYLCPNLKYEINLGTLKLNKTEKDKLFYDLEHNMRLGQFIFNRE